MAGFFRLMRRATGRCVACGRASDCLCATEAGGVKDHCPECAVAVTRAFLVQALREEHERQGGTRRAEPALTGVDREWQQLQEEAWQRQH